MAHYVKIVQGAIAEAYNPSTRNKPNDGNWAEVSYDMTPAKGCTWDSLKDSSPIPDDGKKYEWSEEDFQINKTKGWVLLEE